MRLYVCDDYIKTDAVDIASFMLTVTNVGISLLPCGYGQRYNEIDVECVDGYITR